MTGRGRRPASDGNHPPEPAIALTPTDAPIVISASRRTDIPAFYMEWFMAGIQGGAFEVENPFNRHRSRVPVGPQRVHSIVFWSKNYGPFLDNRYGERIRAAGYHPFFNFTVNSVAPVLEPGVLPLADRLSQMGALARRFGADAIQWRFDPIVFYRTADGRRLDNLGDFDRIADAAAAAGITRCVTSFMDPYAKIDRRLRRRAHRPIAFESPTPEAMARVLTRLATGCQRRGIRLQTCCEPDGLAAVSPDVPVSAGACISGERLGALFGGRPSLRRDGAQRRSAGCRCTVSRDIGSYRLHPCRHDCLYCYAAPISDQPVPSAANGA